MKLRWAPVLVAAAATCGAVACSPAAETAPPAPSELQPVVSATSSTAAVTSAGPIAEEPIIIGRVEHIGGGGGAIRLRANAAFLLKEFEPAITLTARDDGWRVLEQNTQSIVLERNDVTVVMYGLAGFDQNEMFEHLGEVGQGKYDTMVERGADDAAWEWEAAGTSVINSTEVHWHEITVALTGLAPEREEEAFFLSFSGASYVAVGDRIRFHAVPHGDLTFVIAVAWPSAADLGLPPEAMALLEELTIEE